MKLLDEQYATGQASYARGIALRAIVEHAGTLMDGGKTGEAMSLLVGYLDGVVTAIRRTDNLLTLTGAKK